jgi:hypothetical protein
MALDPLPVKTVNQTGHIALHELIRTNFLDVETRLAALEALVDELDARPNIIVSTTEPAHDASQRDGDIWVKEI